jgi:hypothetical protein
LARASPQTLFTEESMANRSALVKQADLTRYMRAMQNAGVTVGRVLVRPDGAVEIIPKGAEPVHGIGPDPDELLR